MTPDARAAALALCGAVERECTAAGPFGIVRATELQVLCNAVRRAAAAALRATPSEDWGRAEVTDRLTRARDTALLTTMRYLCGTPDEQGVTPTEYTFQAARSELERALAAVAAFREATGTKEENDVPMR